jgi:hypothetical protein
LRASTAECSCNRPADSAPAFTGIDSVKGLVGGSRANTIFGDVFPSLLPAAHHDFPAIQSSFMGAAFIGISIHNWSLTMVLGTNRAEFHVSPMGEKGTSQNCSIKLWKSASYNL